MNTMKNVCQKPRPMHCPVCITGRIIDIAANMDAARVLLYPPQQSQQAQFFCKCPKCKQQIGISLCAS